MSTRRDSNPFTELAPPAEAGAGYVFLRVGQLIRKGDEFWSAKARRWVPAENVFHAVAECFRNRYRRKAA